MVVPRYETITVTTSMPRQVGLRIYATVSGKSKTFFFDNKIADNSFDEVFLSLARRCDIGVP